MTKQPDNREILTREDVLELLSKKASDGSVTAMVCLERALRNLEPTTELDAEIDRSSAAMTEPDVDEWTERRWRRLAGQPAALLRPL